MAILTTPVYFTYGNHSGPLPDLPYGYRYAEDEPNCRWLSVKTLSGQHFIVKINTNLPTFELIEWESKTCSKCYGIGKYSRRLHGYGLICPNCKGTGFQCCLGSYSISLPRTYGGHYRPRLPKDIEDWLTIIREHRAWVQRFLGTSFNEGLKRLVRALEAISARFKVLAESELEDRP